MRKTFTPDIEQVCSFTSTVSIAEMERETGVYAASPAFVREHCGPIAVEILDSVPDSYLSDCESMGYKPNIDVRIHRLNPGEYPAVPGWHCDGAMRETYFAQPDIERIPVRRHLIGTVSTHDKGVSNTEFVVEPVTCSIGDCEDDQTVWAQVHRHVQSISPSTELGCDGKLYEIDCETIHRATPAKVRGWRMFFRMNMWHNDYLGDGGKVAKQQQVYIKHTEGW